jgi:hypothetical protein
VERNGREKEIRMNLFLFPFEIKGLQNPGECWHGYSIYIDRKDNKKLDRFDLIL